MAKAFDAQSWEFTQRVIRLNHNREVKRYFKDIASDTRTSTGRAVLKTSLLIRDADSAIETLNKQVYFNNIRQLYGVDSFITYPEDFQIRAEQERPQLIVVYRPTKKELSSKNYPLSLPHYQGSKTPKIKGYYKGKNWGRLVLKDNSHLRVNARSRVEAISMLKHLLNHVAPKYKVNPNQIKTGLYQSDNFKVLKMRPYRADYYQKGKRNNYPDWQHYF